MRHITALYIRHGRLIRLVWVAALVALAACNNGDGGGGADDGGGIY
jgi:hypothetical protein